MKDYRSKTSISSKIGRDINVTKWGGGGILFLNVAIKELRAGGQLSISKLPPMWTVLFARNLDFLKEIFGTLEETCQTVVIRINKMNIRKRMLGKNI